MRFSCVSYKNRLRVTCEVRNNIRQSQIFGPSYFGRAVVFIYEKKKRSLVFQEVHTPTDVYSFLGSEKDIRYKYVFIIALLFSALAQIFQMT